ncbi:hypothetical protein [Runella limosa]|uniref:hypothetical protein n=1 Tax=Runella limosa TaxID=370978 RepID=UPI0004174BC4|nr:hypothetical protein [Runella limosa]
MAANTATVSGFHGDGVIKDGDPLFSYLFKDANDADYEQYKVIARKHPSSSKIAIAIVKLKVNGAAVSDSTQYLKGAEFLRDLKPKMGISGVNDDVIESIAALAMTSAELTAAGTPVDSQLPTVATGIDMNYESYTSNTKAGFVRAKTVTTTLAPAVLTAADPETTTVDWNKVILYFGIGTVVTIGGILIFKAFKKGRKRNAKGQYKK